MREHAILWEDGGYIGYRCPNSTEPSGHATSSLHRDWDAQGAPCPVCGRMLYPIWDVRINEGEDAHTD